jgi:hypothetical protein
MRYPTFRSWIMLNLILPAQATWPREVDRPGVPAGGRANAGLRRPVSLAPTVGEHRGSQLRARHQALGNCPACLGIGCNDCCHTGR